MSTRDRLPRWGQAKNEAILRKLSSSAVTDPLADDDTDDTDTECA